MPQNPDRRFPRPAPNSGTRGPRRRVGTSGGVGCTHVPSELLLLVLPSVDSRLPWRVTRLRISTAMPVSVLRRILLRSFLVAPSGTPENREREQGQVTDEASVPVLPRSPHGRGQAGQGSDWRQGLC